MKRQSDRENFYHDRPRKSSRRPIRLVVESLEARRLLAGLNVSVFVDQDGSRTADAADTAATRRVVFLDLNNNGQQDSTDPIAFTNDLGIASFDDIAPGDYSVGLVSGTLQTQTFPYRVEELATNVGPAAQTLIASEDLSKVWAFEGDGQGHLISSSPETSTVRLGGAIIASTNVGSDAWIVIRSNNSPSSTKLVQFNLETGKQKATEIRGLNGRSIDKLVNAGNQVVAQLSSPRGTQLAKVSLVSGIPTIGVSASFPKLVNLSSASNELAIIEYDDSLGNAMPTVQSQPFTTKLSMLDLKDFSVKATTILPQLGKEVSVSADGRLVLVAISTGGVLVLNNDAALSEAATLAEATGPLLTQATDSRIVTGNATNALEFIVWDVDSWQPSGRTSISPAIPTSILPPDAVSDVVLANSGDRLVATGILGTVASHLALPTTAPVTIPEEGNASVQLGVRVFGDNEAPDAAPVTASFPEDNSTSGNLRSQVADADQDTLWFDVLRAPSHGRLRVDPTGDWSYQPSDNFNGIDRAIVRVYDGQTSSDLALVLNVSPVNDPPRDLRAEFLPIPESAGSNPAEAIGFVTIFDVDLGSSYRFETPDQRFQIRNGKIYVTPGAKLDFETEPTIQLEIFAIEDVASGYQISTTTTLSIADINEPPTAIRILNASVPENVMGATVGKLQIDDPDRVNTFEYALTDSRFIVEDGFLKLKPGVELDFEQGSSINLSLTVTDASGQSFTQPVTLTVSDRNDAPTSMHVRVRPLQEATPGAVVGTVTVSDQDQQAYNFTVSDGRFEVVAGELKLRDGQTVSKTVDPNLQFTVTATSVTGNDTISSSVAVTVVERKSPFQNPVDPRDVNGDGKVSPLDALILINHINSSGAGPVGRNTPLGGSGEAQIWVDVNGDGRLSPIDILLIINFLNRRVVQSEELKAEGEANYEPIAQTSSRETGLPGTSDFSLTRLEETRTTAGLACPAIETRTDSEIDHELENLLDQLSRERLSIQGA